jgi:LemA protein
MYLFLVPLIIAAALLLWGVAIYNRLIKQRNLLEEGASGIDVQLKRRADLIPNLLETVKGYMGHERETLEDVTRLRTSSLESDGKGMAEKGRAEGLLGAALGRLFAVAENYPELKADRNFAELQETLESIEEQVQLARRYYNGTARNLNILVQSFPSNIIARAFGFGTAEFFEIDTPADREVPRVDFR